MSGIEEPSDFLKICINNTILIKCKGNIEVTGNLQGFDEHTNLLIHNTIEKNLNTFKERNLGTTFIRGDLVMLISLSN